MVSPPNVQLRCTEGPVQIIKSSKPLSYLHNRRYLNPIIPKAYVCKEKNPLKSLLQEEGEYQLSLPFKPFPGEKLRIS